MRSHATLLALALCLSFTSCDKSNNENNDRDENTRNLPPTISKHEELADRFIDSMKGLALAVSTVTDLESANAAASTISELGDQFAPMAEELKLLDPPSRELNELIDKKMRKVGMAAEFQKPMPSLSPEAMQVLQQAFGDFFGKLDEVQEEFDRHFGLRDESGNLLSESTLYDGGRTREPDYQEADYQTIHKDGLRKISFAADLDAQYATVNHSITNLRWKQPQPLSWNSEAFIHDRFTLSLRIPVNVDFVSKTVTPVGEPQFWLYATDGIEIVGGEITKISFDGNLQRRFGRADWVKLKAADFDLKALGIPAEEIRPEKNFQEYAKSERRIQIK